MAEIKKAIRIGDVLTNLIDSDDGSSVNYRKNENITTENELQGSLIVKKGSEYFEKIVDIDLTSEDTPVTNITNDNKYNAFPGLIYLGHGEILIAYRIGTDHQTTYDGELVTKRSYDYGKTWSDHVVVLKDDNVDYRDSSLTLLKDGTVLMSYFYRLENGQFNSFTIKSVDKGMTWSSPSELPSFNPTSITALSSKVLELFDGSLMQATYGYDSSTGTNNMFLYKSIDKGDTWVILSNIGGIVYPNAGAYTEPCIIQAPTADGHIIAFVRRLSQFISVTKSYDGGLTWSPMVDKFRASSRAVAYFYKNDLLLSYRGKESTSIRLEPPMLISSNDFGETFNTGVRLDESEKSQDVYSAFDLIGDKTFAFIYGLEDNKSDYRANLFFRYISYPESFGFKPMINAKGLLCKGASEFDGHMKTSSTIEAGMNAGYKITSFVEGHQNMLSIATLPNTGIGFFRGRSSSPQTADYIGITTGNSVNGVPFNNPQWRFVEDGSFISKGGVKGTGSENFIISTNTVNPNITLRFSTAGAENMSLNGNRLQVPIVGGWGGTEDFEINTGSSNLASNILFNSLSGPIGMIHTQTKSLQIPRVGAMGTNGLILSSNTINTSANVTIETANQNSAVFKGNGDVSIVRGNFEIEGASKGVVLRSPNGTRYKLIVSDSGDISTEPL